MRGICRIKFQFYIFSVFFFIVTGILAFYLHSVRLYGLAQRISDNKISPNSAIQRFITQRFFSEPIKQETDYHPLYVDPERIFSGDHSWVSTLSAQRIRTVVATGDIMLARSVNKQVAERNNYLWPYIRILSILKNADATLINLESPLIPDCPLTDSGMIFCGDPRNINGLEYAGIDVANIANNHIGNYGPDGIRVTTDMLNNADIGISGTHRPFIKDIRGLKIGFIGFNDIGETPEIILPAQMKQIAESVKAASAISDLVVVSFHWGEEYTRQPNARQVQLAFHAINSGADIIIGNHPHWVQPVLRYGKGFIVFAHGNTIFDQMWSEETTVGVIGKYVLYDDILIDVEFIPIKIASFRQPYILDQTQSDMVLTMMRNESVKLEKNHINAQ